MSAGDSVEKLRELAREWRNDTYAGFSETCADELERVIPQIIADRDRLLETFEGLAVRWESDEPWNSDNPEMDNQDRFQHCASELRSAIRAAKGGKGDAKIDR